MLSTWQVALVLLLTSQWGHQDAVAANVTAFVHDYGRRRVYSLVDVPSTRWDKAEEACTGARYRGAAGVFAEPDTYMKRSILLALGSDSNVHPATDTNLAFYVAVNAKIVGDSWVWARSNVSFSPRNRSSCSATACFWGTNFTFTGERMIVQIGYRNANHNGAWMMTSNATAFHDTSSQVKGFRAFCEFDAAATDVLPFGKLPFESESQAYNNSAPVLVGQFDFTLTTTFRPRAVAFSPVVGQLMFRRGDAGGSGAYYLFTPGDVQPVLVLGKRAVRDANVVTQTYFPCTEETQPTALASMILQLRSADIFMAGQPSFAGGHRFYVAGGRKVQQLTMSLDNTVDPVLADVTGATYCPFGGDNEGNPKLLNTSAIGLDARTIRLPDFSHVIYNAAHDALFGATAGQVVKIDMQTHITSRFAGHPDGSDFGDNFEVVAPRDNFKFLRAHTLVWDEADVNLYATISEDMNVMQVSAVTDEARTLWGTDGATVQWFRGVTSGGWDLGLDKYTGHMTRVRHTLYILANPASAGAAFLYVVNTATQTKREIDLSATVGATMQVQSVAAFHEAPARLLLSTNDRRYYAMEFDGTHTESLSITVSLSGATPSTSQTPSVTVSPPPTASMSLSWSLSRSITPTVSKSRATPSLSLSGSISLPPTRTQTASPSATVTLSVTLPPTRSLTFTASSTPSESAPTRSPTASPSHSAATGTFTRSPSPPPTHSRTWSATGTVATRSRTTSRTTTVTSSLSASFPTASTSGPSASPTPAPTPSVAATATPRKSGTATASAALPTPPPPTRNVSGSGGVAPPPATLAGGVNGNANEGDRPAPASPPAAVPTTVASGGQGAAVAASGGAALSGGSPGWAAHAARSALLTRLVECPEPLDGDEPLDATMNPTGLAVGDSAARQYVGAIVANVSLLLGVALLQAAVGAVLYATDCRQAMADWADGDEGTTPADDGEAASKQTARRSILGGLLGAKLPRANYMWFLLFLQPVSEAALVLVVQGGDDGLLVAVGVVVFVAFQAASVGMVYQVTGTRLQAVYVPRPWTLDPDAAPDAGPGGDEDSGATAPPSNPLVSAFTPRGDWQPADPASVTARLHHSAFKPLYAPFRHGGRLFILADLVIALVFGAAGSVFPETREQCMGQISVIVGSGFVYFITAIVMRPFAVPIDNVLLAALSFLEFAGAVSLFVHVSYDPESRASRGAKDWTDIFAALAIWLTILIVVKDCVVVVALTVMKHCDGNTARRRRHRDAVEGRRRFGSNEPFEAAAASSPNPIACAFSHRPRVVGDHGLWSQARFDAASALDDDAWHLAPDCHHWMVHVPDPAASDGAALCEVWQDPDTGRMLDVSADTWSV